MASHEKRVSKSVFKSQALEFLRQVEAGTTLVLTDRGRPVVRLIPYQVPKVDEILARLRGSVVHYDDPTGEVDQEEWEALS